MPVTISPPPLLELNSNGQFKSSNNSELNNLLVQISSSYTIQPWLTAATEDDHSGDIYLNRIYRIIFNDLNRNMSLLNIKDELSLLSPIYHVEYDYLNFLTYQPNDTRYNQQWSRRFK